MIGFKASHASLILGLCVAILFSCKEDSALDALTRRKRTLTDVLEWKLVSLKVGLSEIPLEACMTDNVFKFQVDDNYAFDEGPAKCDPDDPQSMSGEWTLTPTGDGLVITADGTTKMTTIDELTESRLRIHYDLGPLRYEEVYEPK